VLIFVFLLFYILIGRTFPVKVLLLILSFVLGAQVNDSFSQNSRHNLSVVLEAPGRNRGRLIIVSFAPFHPPARSNPGFGWGVIQFILSDRTADP
jgi:hypothetical protein